MASLLRAALLLVLASAPGCASADDGAADDDTGDEAAAQLGVSEDALRTAPFLRTDQASFHRTPDNTAILSDLVAPDFSDPAGGAARVIAALRGVPAAKPAYVGVIHTWDYEASARYRTDVHAFLSRVKGATHHTVLVYFEERNASHGPTPVSAAHANALREVAGDALLLCATYVDGRDSLAEVSAKILHYKSHYHGALGVPMSALVVDVDLSDTPSGFYYGADGDLAAFDRSVRRALSLSYAYGFAGFHSIGNSGGNFGVKRASDATYAALDAGWRRLVAAHPGAQFAGL